MDGEVYAGEFGAWLGELSGALAGGSTTDVPCGSCTACCCSAQFVHIGPDEADALAHIPAELLFPAPNLPRGHVVMGYDQDGRCPMLGADGCTIYAHRPVTCRTYDCRVFAAAGVEPDDDKPAIAERTRRWRFSYADANAEALHAAVRAAARFVGPHRVELGSAPNNTQIALAATTTHDLFVDGTTPTVDSVQVRLMARR